MTQETDKPQGVKILGGKGVPVSQDKPVQFVGGNRIKDGVEIIEQRKKPE